MTIEVTYTHQPLCDKRFSYKDSMVNWSYIVVSETVLVYVRCLLAGGLYVTNLQLVKYIEEELEWPNGTMAKYIVK